MKTKTEYQRDFRRRMAETHQKCAFYMPKEDYEKLMEIAHQKGWVNRTGTKAGQPNLQQALNEVIRAGLNQFEDEDYA